MIMAHPLNSVEENLARFIDPNPFSSDDEEEEGEDKNGEDEGEDDENGDVQEEQIAKMDEAEDVGEELNDIPSESFDATDAKDAKEKDFEDEEKGEDQNAKDDAILASAEESLRQLLNAVETEQRETSSIPENNHSTIRALFPLHPPPPRVTHSRSLTLSVLLAVTPTDFIALDHVLNREDPHEWKPPSSIPSIDNRLQDLQQEVQRRLHQQAIQQPHYWNSHEHLSGIRDVALSLVQVILSLFFSCLSIYLSRCSFPLCLVLSLCLSRSRSLISPLTLLSFLFAYFRVWRCWCFPRITSRRFGMELVYFRLQFLFITKMKNSRSFW